MVNNWIIRVASSFSSAHALKRNGKLIEPLHGHKYKIEVFLVYKGDPDQTGVTVDFTRVRRVLQEIIKELDYTNLNTIFHHASPSSENIALWVLQHFKKRWDGPGQLSKIRVWEDTDRYIELHVGQG